jgi:hypothetical protein
MDDAAALCASARRGPVAALVEPAVMLLDGGHRRDDERPALLASGAIRALKAWICCRWVQVASESSTNPKCPWVHRLLNFSTGCPALDAELQWLRGAQSP